MENKSNPQSLIENAGRRAQHFANALAWYGESLKNNSDFVAQFMSLAQSLCLCAREHENVKHVFLIAVGKSAQVADLFASMLVSVGVLARFVHPTEAYHGDLGVVGHGDIVVMISNNGSSVELLQLLNGLKERKASLYAITSKRESPLAKACEHVLLIPPVEEMCPLKQAPLTSTLSTLGLCQLLVAASMEMRSFSLEKYAKNHPGGAIGRRIFLKVDDLMHQGSSLPQIAPEASFQTVVSEFTRFSKGALLVTHKQKLLGLISEKDLRKAMEKHGPTVFSLHAKDLMNPSPTTISTGMLAVDVLKRMTERTPPLNLFPVLDAQGCTVGLIHIHDLISAGVVIS